MKMLLTFALALTFSQAYAQSFMSSGAPAGSATAAMPEATISNPNAVKPTFGTDVPYKKTTSEKATESMTSDTIGTTQSSTTTIKPRRVIPITPPALNPSGTSCVDRSGRTFNTGDSGYTGCVNSMRTR